MNAEALEQLQQVADRLLGRGDDADALAVLAALSALRPPVDDHPRLTVPEFRRMGLLQEVNRRLLHPLGYALESRGDSEWRLGGVWNHSADPEGMCFMFDTPDGQQGMADRAAGVDALWAARTPARAAALGYVVQPIPRPQPSP